MPRHERGRPEVKTRHSADMDKQSSWTARRPPPWQGPAKSQDRSLAAAAGNKRRRVASSHRATVTMRQYAQRHLPHRRAGATTTPAQRAAPDLLWRSDARGRESVLLGGTLACKASRSPATDLWPGDP